MFLRFGLTIQGPEICQRPGFTRGSGSSGYSSPARWSDLFVPLLFNQVISFVNGYYVLSFLRPFWARRESYKAIGAD